jgi:hypothetical protein
MQALLSGQYCDVLAPRHMGKSSLVARTAERLRQRGVRTAVIGLAEAGTDLNADEWYLGLITRLKQELGLVVDERAWWDEHTEQSAVQRFSKFLRYVVLEEIPGSVVVFVDEVESTLSLPFTDGFFAAIRVAHDARLSDPAYRRLTFVLLGVARRADLVKNRFRLPYDIGVSIDLHDFTPEEARKFLGGLEAFPAGKAQTILERVLYWTAGHPYLAQKVCAAIVATGHDSWPPGKIDRLVERLFLSAEASEDDNLRFVRDYIQGSRDCREVLRIYRQVLSGEAVVDDERDPIKNALKLAGLVKVTPRGTLTVRNRIYAKAFDSQWSQEAMPGADRWRIAAAVIVGAFSCLTMLVLLTGLMCNGIPRNGSFECEPELAHWASTGTLPVERTAVGMHGDYSARLGMEVSPTPQLEGKAVLYQLVTSVPGGWSRPVLSFSYQMVVNDIMAYSDFHASLVDSGGVTHEIKRDGFNHCERVGPTPGLTLGWRTMNYDLSDFKGQAVRLVFENRNLHEESQGIWTYVDHVRLEDLPHVIYLPVTYRSFSVSGMSDCELACEGKDCQCCSRCASCIWEDGRYGGEAGSCYPCVGGDGSVPAAEILSATIPSIRSPTPAPVPP